MLIRRQLKIFHAFSSARILLCLLAAVLLIQLSGLNTGRVFSEIRQAAYIIFEPLGPGQSLTIYPKRSDSAHAENLAHTDDSQTVEKEQGPSREIDQPESEDREILLTDSHGRPDAVQTKSTLVDKQSDITSNQSDSAARQSYQTVNQSSLAAMQAGTAVNQSNSAILKSDQAVSKLSLVAKQADTQAHQSDPAVQQSDSSAIKSNQTGSNPLTIQSVEASYKPDFCPHLPLNFPTNASFFPCEWRSALPPNCTQRPVPRFSCNGSYANILYEWVSIESPPTAYNFTDDCLMRVVVERCTEKSDLIPKLVHFVTFGGRPMTFYTFLGVLSTVRYVQPCLVMFHADRLPTGKYWDTLLRMVPQILHVKRQPPKAIFGHEVKVIEHQADIARLEAVKTFGGLYIDTDYVLLNPIEDLRNHTAVMGNTIPNYNYCNCVFMGKAGAEFFDLWYDGYRTFDDKKWGYHSTVLPYKVHKEHPEVPFTAVDTFVRPWFKDIKQKFYENYFDFESKHGLHLYVRLNKQYFKVDDYEVRNSSLGRLARRVLFGHSEACFNGEGLKTGIARVEV